MAVELSALLSTGVQVKEDEFHLSCRTHRRHEKCIQNYTRKPYEYRPLPSRPSGGQEDNIKWTSKQFCFKTEFLSPLIEYLILKKNRAPGSKSMCLIISNAVSTAGVTHSDNYK